MPAIWPIICKTELARIGAFNKASIRNTIKNYVFCCNAFVLYQTRSVIVS